MKEVKDYIKQLHMVQRGDHILVGFSAGADSICLLHFLWNQKEKFGIQVSAVHVNHSIRQTAIRDEEFAKTFCDERSIPFYSVTKDVPSYAKEQNMSEEEAGRTVRYQVFEETAKQIGATKIALAHHMDDQAETVLLHLGRGTGLQGLGGIKPVRGSIIRPLLCVSRKQIEEYVAREGLQYVTDETNAQLIYTRNFVRGEIMPRMNQICDNVSEHIASAAEICRQAQDYLLMQVEAAISSHTLQEDKRILIKDSLLREHPYLQNELVLQVMGLLAGSKKDVTRKHVASVLSLFEKQVSRKVELPYALIARKDYEGVIIENRRKLQEATKQTEISINLEDVCKRELIVSVGNGANLIFRVLDYEEGANIPQNQYTKWFDYDKIKQCLVVRNRQVGDYFYVNENGSQTVKAYMINEKIPAEKRNNIAMVCEDNHVLWMVGYRISSFYKVTDQTKQILEIRYEGENNG